MDLFPSSGEKKNLTLIGLSELISITGHNYFSGTQQVGVSLPSSEERNRFSFEILCF
jgi:hypothetical protein